MSDFAILASPAPYHILSYGTLLGTQVYQSFVGGVVGYKTLPRPQFSSLQQAIFPIYFSIQTALPAVLALTYPGESSLSGSVETGIRGVLSESNRVTVLVPLLTIFSTSLLNLLYLGPTTTKIMQERKHQETRDGKKSYDAPPHSKEMTRLNKAFGRMHGASALLNMVGLIGTVYYGVVLSERLR